MNFCRTFNLWITSLNCFWPELIRHLALCCGACCVFFIILKLKKSWGKKSWVCLVRHFTTFKSFFFLKSRSSSMNSSWSKLKSKLVCLNLFCFFLQQDLPGIYRCWKNPKCTTQTLLYRNWWGLGRLDPWLFPTKQVKTFNLKGFLFLKEQW